MSRKRLTPEQIIGKLRKAEVALSAIYQHVTKKKIVVDMRFKTTF
jgi:IS30 family transposase